MTARSSLSIRAVVEAAELFSKFLPEESDRHAEAPPGRDPHELFVVTLPEALPIAVISRFIGWFHEFGIPVGGVIVNMVLDRAALGADVPEFVLNRMQMQAEHRRTIAERFDGSVRAVVPLFDQEVRGTARLGETARALFA